MSRGAMRLRPRALLEREESIYIADVAAQSAIDRARARDPLVGLAAIGAGATAFATAPSVPSGLARGAIAFFAVGGAVYLIRELLSGQP